MIAPSSLSYVCRLEGRCRTSPSIFLAPIPVNNRKAVSAAEKGGGATRQGLRRHRAHGLFVTILGDCCQKRPLPTTIGGGASTVELARQVVERCRQSISLRFVGLASDWADWSCFVGM